MTWTTKKIAECVCPFCGAVNPVNYHEGFQVRVQGRCQCGASYYPRDNGDMMFCSQKAVKTVQTIAIRCGACNEKRKYNIVSKLWMCPACGGWEGNETTTL